jgi:hypothetical protein
MVARKQREREREKGGVGGQDIPFKGMPPITYFL